jgi:hypothetical protein
LQHEFDTLAGEVPVELAALGARLEAAGKNAKSLPASVTPSLLEAARTASRDAHSLWERAQLERSAARLPEAVTLANQARALAKSVNDTLDGKSPPPESVK